MTIKNESNKLEINILRRSNPEAQDFWDGNWLETEIRIQVSGFNGLYDTNLRVEDLQKFYNDLSDFQKLHSKIIEFTTMEEGLYLRFEQEPTGVINFKGVAKNDSGNNLEFDFQIDPISIEGFINELVITLNAYPLIGTAH